MGQEPFSGQHVTWHSCAVPLQPKSLALQNWMVTSQQSVVNAAVSSPFPGVVLGKFSWQKLKGQGLC